MNSNNDDTLVNEKRKRQLEYCLFLLYEERCQLDHNEINER